MFETQKVSKDHFWFCKNFDFKNKKSILFIYLFILKIVLFWKEITNLLCKLLCVSHVALIIATADISHAIEYYRFSSESPLVQNHFGAAVGRKCGPEVGCGHSGSLG